jgi:high-affinity Fe2+/Pb2+ permease
MWKQLTKFRAYGFIIVGVLVGCYAAAGIAKYGFYISGRGSLGQIEGGLAPFLLLIAVLFVAYGIVDLWLHHR